MPPDPLDEMLVSVRSKPGYRDISPDLIRWVGLQEIQKRRNLKEAIRFTRSRLHQVAGAYQDTRMDYIRWQEELSSLSHSREDPDLQAFCRMVMTRHASSRERLSILETFYKTILEPVAPLRSILDVGCGMNPLALPWFTQTCDFTYFGVDVFERQAVFLNTFLSHIQAPGAIRVYNLGNGLPLDLQPVQVTLFLKILPCLEQLDKSLPDRLLDQLDSDWLVVSYPVQSLGGRSKGMLQNYEKHFRRIAEPRGWQPYRFEFQTELAFLVRLK
jgi:16S rRNA (guanine(1405)-N(7))-methyltransferase